MKTASLALFLTAFSSFLTAQKIQEPDLWSGSYEIYTEKDSPEKSNPITIVKTKDLTADEVASKLEADLARWNIISEQNGKKDTVMVRRFLHNSEHDEYEEFGWTALHSAGKMSCIDGGHFFICQTKAQTTIELKGDKPFFTETGFFGVWLHYGLVNLKKVL